MATNSYLSASAAAALAAASIPDDFTSNTDGTYTYTDSVGGASVTFTSADLISLNDNGDSTWTMTLPDGSSTVDIDINEALGNLTAAGVTNLMAALDFNQLTAPQQQDFVTGLSGNATAMASLAAALGSDAILDNADGTYTHTAFDGTVLQIDTNAASAKLLDVNGNFTATNIEDALAEIASSISATSDTDISAAALGIVGDQLEVKVTEDGVDQVGTVSLAVVASAFPAGSIPASALAAGADTNVSAVEVAIAGANLRVKVSENGNDYTGFLPLSTVAGAFPAGSIAGSSLAAGVADTDISAAALAVSGSNLKVKITEDGVSQIGSVSLADLASGFPAGSIPASALAVGAADTDVSGISLSVVGSNLQVKITEDGADYVGTVPLSAISSPDSIDDDPSRSTNAYLANDQMAVAAVGGVDEKVDAKAYVANILATNPLGYAGTPSLSQLTALGVTPSGPPFNIYIDDSVCPNELTMWDACENGGSGGYVSLASSAPAIPPASYASSQTFAHTGQEQTFTVPSALAFSDPDNPWLKIEGAGGDGSAYSGATAKGGSAGSGSVEILVDGVNINHGDVLRVIVGGGGTITHTANAGVAYGGFGFGGDGRCIPAGGANPNDTGSGGGLTGLFSPGASVSAADSSRSIVVYPGGGGASDSLFGGLLNSGGGGGDATSGGMSTMAGDDHTNASNTYSGGGGGGYTGGALHKRQASSHPEAGEGGSFFVPSYAVNVVTTQGVAASVSGVGQHGNMTISY